jgi:hypothetical protein
MANSGYLSARCAKTAGSRTAGATTFHQKVGAPTCPSVGGAAGISDLCALLGE